jgi:hypothetical protein
VGWRGLSGSVLPACHNWGAALPALPQPPSAGRHAVALAIAVASAAAATTAAPATATTSTTTAAATTFTAFRLLGQRFGFLTVVFADGSLAAELEAALVVDQDDLHWNDVALILTTSVTFST